MRSKTLTGCRNAVLRVFIALAAIAAGLAILWCVLFWRPSLESGVAQANQLIAAAGGPAKILKEADEIFAHFGISEEEWHPPDGRYESPYITDEMENKYPALAALNKQYGVAIPIPNMSIHFGGHNGFFITIWPSKRTAVHGDVDLFDSRIFLVQ